MSPPPAGATKKLLLPLLAAGRRSSPPQAHLCRSYSAPAYNTGASAKRSLARRIVSIGLLSLAGGLALSAINDLAIFHGCSSKAIEKATDNREVVEAIGVPIVRGPWYDASLSVGHRRRSVSCTFPVSGPQGSGIFQFEAIRNGDDGLLSFLRHHDWEILIMEAHLHDDDKQKTVKISVTSSADNPSIACDCKSTPGPGECEQPEQRTS